MMTMMSMSVTDMQLGLFAGTRDLAHGRRSCHMVECNVASGRGKSLNSCIFPAWKVIEDDSSHGICCI